uniref:Uncharacterized protein n=1 Tax=Caenorhabditis japonica TaxID=281687 RepID=A0A8R1DGH7_CAEJA
MPTFKLDDLDVVDSFGGDNDIYFRQWRVPSMKPVLDKKIDRDFRETMVEKENLCTNRAEKKKRHDRMFEKRMEEVKSKMRQSLQLTKHSKHEPFLRTPTEQEVNTRREQWNREYETPSSTAVMTQAKQLPERLKPRIAPIFGQNMAGLKNLVLPPSSSREMEISENSSPKVNTSLNNSHDTIFYPQNHTSFNLDHYNGNRPSFAFAGVHEATSTPVSKFAPKFVVGIAEEENSLFDESKYVTAFESPIQNSKIRQQDDETLRKSQEKTTREMEKVITDRKEIASETTEKESKTLKEAEEKNGHILNVETRGKLEVNDAREILKQEAEAVPARKPGSSLTRPFILFKNYITLLPQLLHEKKAYETTTDQNYRSLLKRTVIENMTILTRRETSNVMRTDILQFFKNLLTKKEVDGFSVIGEVPKLQLSSDEDVNYAIHFTVEKYISLAELDDELSTTISDLLSRLSMSVRRIEKVFIVMMLNKCVTLRQNPDECIEQFVEKVEDRDNKAIVLNRENALLSLFFNVFVKNAHFSSKGRKTVLNEDLLWKYGESVVAHAVEVPKAAMVILQLITNCKPQLCRNSERWSQFLSRISGEVLPCLEDSPFPGDESVISKLAQIIPAVSR